MYIVLYCHNLKDPHKKIHTASSKAQKLATINNISTVPYRIRDVSSEAFHLYSGKYLLPLTAQFPGEQEAESGSTHEQQSHLKCEGFNTHKQLLLAVNPLDWKMGNSFPDAACQYPERFSLVGCHSSQNYSNTHVETSVYVILC